MTSRAARMARGWIGAGVSTFLAAASHILAGGDAPVLPILILSLALSGLVCTILAGRLLSMWRLLVGVLLSQALFHGLFSLGMSAGSAPTMVGHAGHSTQQMAQTLQLASASAPMMEHSSPLMWVSHVFAAVFTVVVLRRGESVAIALIDALRLKISVLIHCVRIVATEGTPALRPNSWPVRVLPSLGNPCAVMRYRGPPRFPALSALF